jgi:predicted kinase
MARAASQPQACLILVAGLPGSGKSYFAQRLAKALGATYLSSDRLRKELQAGGRYSMADRLAVYRQLALLAAAQLKTQQAVVVDATFTHQRMRELFLSLAEARRCPLILIWVQAAEALIRQRLALRQQEPGQESEADVSVYELLREKFEEIPGPHLRLESTNSNLHQMLEQALAYIRNAHERS